MYVILLLFVLLFICSIFYLKTNNKEGFEANMHEILPIGVTGTGNDNYQISVPNKIIANQPALAIEFGGALLTKGKLTVEGTELDVSNDVKVGKGMTVGQNITVGQGMTVGQNMTVSGTINAGNVFKKNHDALPPVGSIMSFAGSTDPDGWVICDGVQRTNDGRYNTLITLGIGTGTANEYYSPPNLKNQFLKGADTAANLMKSYSKTQITLTEDNLPSHMHSGTTGNMSDKSNHTHGISDPGHVHGWKFGTDRDDSGYGNGSREFAEIDGQPGGGTPMNIATTGISVNDANIEHTHNFSTSSVGKGIPITVSDPDNVSVNYILKY
jgi:hypothetical protein